MQVSGDETARVEGESVVDKTVGEEEVVPEQRNWSLHIHIIIKSHHHWSLHDQSASEQADTFEQVKNISGLAAGCWLL